MTSKSRYTKVSKSLRGAIPSKYVPYDSTLIILNDGGLPNLLDPNIRKTGQIKTIKESGLPYGTLISTDGIIHPGSGAECVSTKKMKKIARKSRQKFAMESLQLQAPGIEFPMMSSSSSSSSSSPKKIKDKSKKSKSSSTPKIKTKTKKSKSKPKTVITIKSSSKSKSKKNNK